MSKGSQKPAVRRHRGRPDAVPQHDVRRPTGPTLPRLAAARVLERVERTRAFADLTLHAALARSELRSPDRALATELVYGALRWRGRLDYMLSRVMDRGLDRIEPLVLSALRLGAYQILFVDGIPDTAAVDQAVRCTRALGVERATGFVNAVLRRLAREHDEIELPPLEDDPVAHLRHALSLPKWIAERWIALYGPEDAAALASACNRAPRLTIRANRLRIGAAALRGELLERFPEARVCDFAPDGIVLGRRGNAGQDPAFVSGQFTVQDEASQLVVELLEPQLGDRVLDVCAAPGAKSTAIAERVGEDGSVLALDRHPRRLALVSRDARRLGIRWIRTQERDATRPLDDLVGKEGGAQPSLFDRVLVDAPCTGLGSLRRNPDARWRVRPDDAVTLASLQGAILRRAAPLVRPGGRLVYSTCTVLPEENEEQIETFLSEHEDFRLVGRDALPARLAPVLDERGLLHCWPHVHDTDGFFAACLERVE